MEPILKPWDIVWLSSTGNGFEPLQSLRAGEKLPAPLPPARAPTPCGCWGRPHSGTSNHACPNMLLSAAICNPSALRICFMPLFLIKEALALLPNTYLIFLWKRKSEGLTCRGKYSFLCLLVLVFYSDNWINKSARNLETQSKELRNRKWGNIWEVSLIYWIVEINTAPTVIVLRSYTYNIFSVAHISVGKFGHKI